MTPITNCVGCPVGDASNVGEGDRCPMTDRRWKSGAMLFSAGEPASAVWFVKKGTVVLSKPADQPDADGITWAVRGPGAFLGLEALVRDTYVDSARAVTDVCACVTSLRELEAWLDRKHTAARAVLQCAVQAQVDDSPRRASADGSAVRRVAEWLLDGGHEQEWHGLPRRLVAGFLGMQPETLSRALASLATIGAVEVTRRSITVTNRNTLTQAAGRH
jgi:CRP-like cAMP-binding protein